MKNPRLVQNPGLWSPKKNHRLESLTPWRLESLTSPGVSEIEWMREKSGRVVRVVIIHELTVLTQALFQEVNGFK